MKETLLPIFYSLGTLSLLAGIILLIWGLVISARISGVESKKGTKLIYIGSILLLCSWSLCSLPNYFL